jgi:hypothetical protein
LQANLAFTRRDETTNGLEQRGLAAPGRPKQYKAVCRIDFKTHLMGGPHHTLRGAVLQADVIHRQQRRVGAGDVAGRVALQWRVHDDQLPCNGLVSWKK